MSLYDDLGNPLEIGGVGLNGYTMEEEPEWKASKMINTDDPEYDVGEELSATTTLRASDYIPVRGRNTLRIMLPRYGSGTPPTFGLCFYDKARQPLVNSGTSALWAVDNSAPRAEIAEAIVPERAAYFRTTYWSGSQDAPEFTYEFTPGEYRAITHERPANRGMENAIRRSRQITDIEWVSLVRIPRRTSLGADEFKPGVRYRGVPYSGSGQTNNWTYGYTPPSGDSGRWGYPMFFYGHVVSPEQFVTAMRYPNSIFGERSEAEADTVDASIYGSVCTNLLTYALGLPYPIWPISTFMSNESSGKNYFRELGNLGTSAPLADIRLCDVFYNSSHVAIITDIIRDAAGNVTAVEISESTTSGKVSRGAADGGEVGGIARRKTWPAADLLASTWTSSFVMYRFNSFTGIGYTASPYVDTGNEGRCIPNVDLPCIPYLGSGAKYKSGKIVNSKVLIGSSGYDMLVVQKDGATFNTFPITDATEEVTVGFSATGKYRAWLETSGGTRSAACKWEVVA